ncbi:hypothetical protein DAA51_33625 [Bradyrhizobium sp. WBAH10]|nr:hypothetical protein [Bradyrhizobium sp. WBAH30]MDD1547347.1 hypothetical protein [Bradyrhizobium sp. WBAH41]MDD1560985.1 hypothetical protein [Bradyrhizobium sp. WBAH23]MDD1568428.1 hypothetical protein [Bradyrhizobium sp. WBAH33]MDD1594354.1 hypothetical protein [Bradyrhizobium sp. WBAH42]NRB91887.1 hypothetical protein [Bradyrhizobium sp. WBAH10]QCJ92905.1 hypothetical protein DAA57_33870 [Bradyrhizobium yuanmingense]
MTSVLRPNVAQAEHLADFGQSWVCFVTTMAHQLRKLSSTLACFITGVRAALAFLIAQPNEPEACRRLAEAKDRSGATTVILAR